MKRASVLTWLLLATAAFGDGPRPAASLRAERPDEQMRQVLALFDGARAAGPAAALAAWKRSSREPGRLGKPLEALIASFNPAMAGELGTLDGAEVALWFEPDGRLSWGASLPRDDGTFAALATASVLSGGQAEAPIGDLAVDRLGGPGSALMARSSTGLLLGGSPSGLVEARDRLARGRVGTAGAGFGITVEPGALGGSNSLAVRRLAEALRSTGGGVTARVRVEGGEARATLDLAIPHAEGGPAIDPAWLDAVPASRALAAFALAVDPAAGAWDAAFGVLDRVERVDPARANLAPARLRLDLLARAAGVRAEADLLPHLRGVSGWVGADGPGIGAAVVAFHLDDEAAAIRLAARARPLSADPEPAPGPGGSRWLGRLDGRPLRLARQARSVVVGWGERAIDDSTAAAREPAKSAGPSLRRGWGAGPPVAAGGVWPDRVTGLVAGGSPLALALAEAPPITWAAARGEAGRLAVEARWGELAGVVRRFLDRIPLDPPPDR